MQELVYAHAHSQVSWFEKLLVPSLLASTGYHFKGIKNKGILLLTLRTDFRFKIKSLKNS